MTVLTGADGSEGPLPEPGTGVLDVVWGALEGVVAAEESGSRGATPRGPVFAPVAAKAPSRRLADPLVAKEVSLSLLMYALCHWVICASVSGSRSGSP
jgi:hypothetical protein